MWQYSSNPSHVNSLSVSLPEQSSLLLGILKNQCSNQILEKERYKYPERWPQLIVTKDNPYGYGLSTRNFNRYTS